MIKKPLVSIIVPIHNDFPFARNCLYSLVDQSYNNIEILLVDDGSTDLPPVAFMEEVNQDFRIHFFQRDHWGPGAARNYGIQQANGEYLLFVDSDDSLDPQTVETLVSAADFNADGPRPDFILFGCHFYEKGSYKRDRMPTSFKGSQIDFLRKPFYVCYRQGLISAPGNKFIRRSFLLENNLRFSEHLLVLEDLLFTVQVIAEAEQVMALDQAFYHYHRLRKGALMSRFNVGKEQTQLRICQKMLEMTPAHPKYHEFYCKDTALKVFSQLIAIQKQTFSPLRKARLTKKLLRNPELRQVVRAAHGRNLREKQKLLLLKTLIKLSGKSCEMPRQVNA